MLTSTLLPLITIASLAQGLPLNSPSTSESGVEITARTTGQSVTGSLRWSGKSSGGTSGTDKYEMLSGDGKSWPGQEKWIKDFDTMFEKNEKIMKTSCAQFSKENDSAEEIKDIKSSIQKVAKETSVDPRFILAIIMQESNGCVRVPTTNGGVVNPGLMQDHNGAAMCTESPCPSSKIEQMIREGTAGTSSGEGLAELINTASKQGATGTGLPFYAAARLYNTGSWTMGSDLGKPKYGTACYSTDVANRLMGWAGSETSCKLKI